MSFPSVRERVKEKQSFRLVSLCATIQKFAQRAKKKKKKAANVSTRKDLFLNDSRTNKKREEETPVDDG